MSEMRAMTLRLAVDQAERLDLVAMVDETPVVEVVRSAIEDYIERRTKDPGFQSRLRLKLEIAESLLDTLDPNRSGS